MTESHDIDAELGAEDRALGERLEAGKPVPRAGFRAALERHLAALDPGYGPRPPRLRLVACSYLGASAVLMALGALQATGAL